MATNLTQSRMIGDAGVLAGFRNKIINGDFDIWQRGTSFTGVEYLADRWHTSSIGGAGGAATLSRQEFPLGQADVPGNPKYFLRHDRTSAGSVDNGVLQQKMEGVRTLAGGRATLTFWAKAAAAKTLSVRLIQNFGTGGAPSANVVASPERDFNLTTAWQKFTFVWDVPSIAGKVLGTDNNDNLFLQFLERGTYTTFTFDVAHVSIVEGDATQEDDPFSPRHIQQELALCQRYYYATGFARGFLPGSSSTVREASVLYPSELRAIPSITAVPSSGTFSVIVNNVLIALIRSSVGDSTTAVSFTNFAADAEL